MKSYFRSARLYLNFDEKYIVKANYAIFFILLEYFLAKKR